MGIISLEQADRLYWLGRYTERVYTTLRMFCQSFDVMIDELGDSYREFCKKLDIPDSYGDKAAFLKQYPFDCENPDSIISNLDRAYGNAVVLRESIGSEALSYIQLDLYARLGAGGKELAREVHRMIPRVERSGLEYEPDKLTLLKDLAEETEPDYYRIVRLAETIL